MARRDRAADRSIHRRAPKVTIILRSLAVAGCLALLAAGTPPLVNLMPAYWSAWDAPGATSSAARAQALQNAVITAHPELYGGREFAALRDPAELERYAAHVAPLSADIRRVAAAIPAQLPAQLEAIRRALPDFSLDGVTVYVVPSFGRYNGRVRPAPNGGLGLFLAPDGIVEGEGAAPHVDVIVAHELFHLYQFQTHPGIDPSTATVWQATWAEGSAVYASQAITGASTPVALGSQELGAADAATTKALACEIRAHADSREMDQYVSGGVHPPNLPTRGGYLIGYLIARDLAKTYALPQIGKLTISELEPQFRARLDRLCTTGALGERVP